VIYSAAGSAAVGAGTGAKAQRPMRMSGCARGWLTDTVLWVSSVAVSVSRITTSLSAFLCSIRWHQGELECVTTFLKVPYRDVCSASCIEYSGFSDYFSKLGMLVRRHCLTLFSCALGVVSVRR